jgi:hypothetical protein
MGGGDNNNIEGSYSSIVGGQGNKAIGNYCFILSNESSIDSSDYSGIIGSNNLLRPTADHSYAIGENIDLSADSTIYLKNTHIVLDGEVSDPAGNRFMPFWTSGDTPYFEVGDSTWVIVRDSVFVTP